MSLPRGVMCWYVSVAFHEHTCTYLVYVVLCFNSMFALRIFRCLSMFVSIIMPLPQSTMPIVPWVGLNRNCLGQYRGITPRMYIEEPL